MSLISEGADLTRPLAPGLARAQPSLAGVEDYIALLKPRVMSLVVFTAFDGLIAAPVSINPTDGRPCSARIIGGTAVTSRSSITRGFVSRT